MTYSVCKQDLKNAGKFKASSQRWLLRQINDVYVKRSKLDHFRCRSAFKLVEINEKYKLFRSGQVVVDLGCAPGSWTQVAVKATNATMPGSKSLVVGMDLSPVHPIEGSTLLQLMDFTTEKAQKRLLEVLAERKVDVVISDMAPATTGIKFMDHTNIVKLCYAALLFAKQTSCCGASLVMKIFNGSEMPQLIAQVRGLYQIVHIVRPAASRKDSTEVFLVCLKFKGDQQDEIVNSALNKSEP